MEAQGSIIKSITTFIIMGGPPMWLVMVVFAVGVAIAIERFMKLTKRYDTDGPSFMNELQRYILSNDIQGAIRICSGTTALLPKVLKSGLKRANQKPEQIQNALDATALEVIPKVEMRLSYLSLIANISTLIGLVGTIMGLIEAFGSIAAADPAQRSELLARGLALGMNTTLMGLVAAIIMMVIHSFLSAKADKIISEIDEYSVKLMDLLLVKEEKES